MPLAVASSGLPPPAGTLVRRRPPFGSLLGSRSFHATLWSPPPRLAARRRAPARVHRVKEEQRISEGSPISNWGDFASCVSGEWDGYGAEFSSDGRPIELPESVVPEAFREWGVEVFDWQTQCPTLAETGIPTLTYRLIKLLPTVGCEADAATRHSTEERVIGGSNNGAFAFAYDSGGSYVAVWNSNIQNVGKCFELEHCLINPSDRKARIRMIQVIRLDEATFKLHQIKVFSENWYGPFRNGEQLGGCAIRESSFAATSALELGAVDGVWQGTRTAASFDGSQLAITELVADMPEMFTRDCRGFVTLPKNLWCSLRGENGETWAEVGWLLQKGHALTSKCIFSDDGNLKSIVLAQEAAVMESM